MSCKYNNCKHCGYKSECEIYKENAELRVNLKWEQDTKSELAEVWGKAKEILKKYHDECPAKYSFEDIDDMAEQFLKECE